MLTWSAAAWPAWSRSSSCGACNGGRPTTWQTCCSPGISAMSFVLATMLWSIFVMQDNALVAVGRPGAVPAENTSFAVLKIVLIAVLAFGAASRTGIWWSWTAAMAVCVGGCERLPVRPGRARVCPGPCARAVEVVTLRDLRRFVGPDYVGSLAWIACTSLVPLLVLDLAGATPCCRVLAALVDVRRPVLGAERVRPVPGGTQRPDTRNCWRSTTGGRSSTRSRCSRRWWRSSSPSPRSACACSVPTTPTTARRRCGCCRSPRSRARWSPFRSARLG